MSGVGSAISTFSSALAVAAPEVAAVGQAAGAAVAGLGGLTEAIDGLVKRYGRYSPAVAQAEAMAQVQQVMQDMRRAQEATPDLVRFIQQRQDLQNKIEDVKIRLLKTAMPLIERMVAIFEQQLPYIEKIFELVVPILDIWAAALEVINGIFGQMKKEDLSKHNFSLSFEKSLAEGFVAPGSAREAELDRTGGAGFRVPRR